MPDSDNLIEILIRFGLDKSQAEAARDEIARTQQATEAAGAAGGAAAKEQEEKIKGLDKAVKMLGNQFGEFGRLARFAFNLPMLAVAGLALAIHKVIQYTEELQKKILDKAELVNAVWEAQRQRANDAAAAAASYADTVDRIATSTDTLKTKEEAELAVLNARFDAQKKLLEAQEKAELAAAGGDKAREAEIKARYGDIQSAEDRAAEQARLDLQRRGFADAQREAAAAKAASDAAQKAAQAGAPGADAAAEAAAILAARTGKNTELEAAFLSAQNSNILTNRGLGGKSLAELRAYAKQQAAAGGISVEGFMSGEVGGAIQRVEETAAALEKNRAEIAAANKLAEDFKLAQERLKNAAEKAASEWESKDRDVQQRKRELDTATDVFGIHKQNARDVELFPRLAGDVGRAEEIAGRGARNPGESEFIRTFGSMVAGQDVNAATAERMFATARANKAIEQQFIQRLLSVVEGMAGPTFQQFTDRLNRIERMVGDLRRP